MKFFAALLFFAVSTSQKNYTYKSRCRLTKTTLLNTTTLNRSENGSKELISEVIVTNNDHDGENKIESTFYITREIDYKVGRNGCPDFPNEEYLDQEERMAYIIITTKSEVFYNGVIQPQFSEPTNESRCHLYRNYLTEDGTETIKEEKITFYDPCKNELERRFMECSDKGLCECYKSSNPGVTWMKYSEATNECHIQKGQPCALKKGIGDGDGINWAVCENSRCILTRSDDAEKVYCNSRGLTFTSFGSFLTAAHLFSILY